MAILVTCEACKAKLRVRDEYLGKEVWCPACKAPLTLTGERVPNHEVFISYSNKDKAVADALCATLEAKSLRCWVAPRDIAAGNSWGGSIIEAIEDAQVMVLVYSSHSNLSPQIIREVERAVAKGLLIVPFRIEAAPMSKDMEYFLSASHWFDALTPPLEIHLAHFAEMVRLILFKKAKDAAPCAAHAVSAKPHANLWAWLGAVVGIFGVVLALGAFMWVRQQQKIGAVVTITPTNLTAATQPKISIVPDPLPSSAILAPPSSASEPASTAWIPLDIAADCTDDIISTAARTSADQFTFNGGRLASASWLRANGFSEPGLPDDGRVQIPHASPPGSFQVHMPPAKNAILLSGPEGVQPGAVTIKLATYERRHYSELAILHSTCWGNGTLRVLLRYETGAERSVNMPVVDFGVSGRSPLPSELSVAVTLRDTHPRFGSTGEMLAGRISSDSNRELSSLTFSVDPGSISPPRPGWSEQDILTRFTIAVFAISGRMESAPATTKEQPDFSRSASASIIAVTPVTTTRATDQQWTNSLGMIFVPVPGTAVRFSIWDTRVQDYQAFVTATGRSWEKPNFEQGPTHPAVMVSWNDAKAFCTWLTEKERRAGTLNANQKYRLPTDLEWSAVVGLENETGRNPQARNGKILDVYPWGSGWPPPRGAGNYASSFNIDNFVYTSPVGSFATNQFGLYDMGGNVWQWCEDSFEGNKDGNLLHRGASYKTKPAKNKPDYHLYLSSYRSGNIRLRDNRIDDIGFRCVLAGDCGSASR